MLLYLSNNCPVSSMVEREAFNLKATGSTPVSGLESGCWRNWQRVRLQSGRLGVQVSHVPIHFCIVIVYILHPSLFV
ncbi:hypothetical protein AYI69_g7865 [Smittium culicis]|uniref:Uncharacterized protein n=1 Tax=Smittium culicis TaxID=133412 RepID=A0A1R1XNY6_9FUNG|nr:hypothetical protein AYI69_g7865 [Smittium culicis]